MTRLWRITTLLIVPKARGNSPTVVGESLQFHSRFPDQARRYGDLTVAVRKAASENPLYKPNPDVGQVEQIDLVADVPVPAGWSGPPQQGAVERFAPVFETLIDLMTFDMAAVPRVGPVYMIDITPPVAVGDQRTELSMSAPPYDRYARGVEMSAIQGRLIGELPAAVDNLDSKTSAVLRWFVKALGTDLLHDQFIFLWIALEILLDLSDVRVEEPYVGPCQHQIAECPECGRATTRMVRGATIKAFLQGYGVPADQAKMLWDMRQLMHGAIPFDSKKLQNLGALIQPLRAVVAARLKTRLGKTITEPPIVAATGFLLHPSAGLGGTRQITEDDIRPLIPDDRTGAP